MHLKIQAVVEFGLYDKLNYELTPGHFRNEKEIYTYQVTLRVAVLCHCVTVLLCYVTVSLCYCVMSLCHCVREFFRPTKKKTRQYR